MSKPGLVIRLAACVIDESLGPVEEGGECDQRQDPEEGIETPIDDEQHGEQDHLRDDDADQIGTSRVCRLRELRAGASVEFQAHDTR